MTLPVTDNFNRVENPLIGNWTTITNESNMLANGSTAEASINSRAGCRWNADTFNNDQYSQAKASGFHVDPNWGVAVRISPSAETLYFVEVSATAWDFSKIINGTYSVIGTVQSRNTSVGTVIKLKVVGTTLTCYFDGVADAYTQTDSDIASGSAGLHPWGVNGVTFDDWEGGDIAAAAVTGTATASITEADIVTGGKTIIITLDGDTFIA